MDKTVDNCYHPYKQQKINHFFAKLTRAEEAEQATKRLVQTADAREEWVEKEEAKKRAKKASRKAANTQAQQECRKRKKESKIHLGRRGQDGKIIKVIGSNVDCQMVTYRYPQVRNGLHVHSTWPKRRHLSKPHAQSPRSFPTTL